MKPTDTTAVNDAARPPADDESRHETQDEADDGLIEDELLVEEISIDGMCGVY